MFSYLNLLLLLINKKKKYTNSVSCYLSAASGSTGNSDQRPRMVRTGTNTDIFRPAPTFLDRHPSRVGLCRSIDSLMICAEFKHRHRSLQSRFGPTQTKLRPGRSGAGAGCDWYQPLDAMPFGPGAGTSLGRVDSGPFINMLVKFSYNGSLF